jgi:putative addiction module antidote
MDTLGSMVELKVKLVKIGNSLRMTVPVEVIEALKLKEGDTLTVDAKDGKMVVSHFSIKKEEQL